MVALKKISCPKCSAPVSYQMGDKIIVCGYCGSASEVKDKELVKFEHYMLASILDRDSLNKIIIGRLKEWIKPDDLISELERIKIEQRYVPLWVARVDAASDLAFGSGGCKRIENTHLERIPGRKDVDIKGLENFRIVEKNIIRFDINRVGIRNFTNVEIDAKTAETNLLLIVKTKQTDAVDARYPPEVRSSSVMHLSVGWVRVVYVPVAHIEYEYKGERYEMYIDCSGGGIVYECSPVGEKERKTSYHFLSFCRPHHKHAARISGL